MFLEVPDILTADEIARLRALAKTVTFVDGRVTNPHNTAKNNLQLDYNDPAYGESSSLCHAALLRHPGVHRFAFPRKMAPPLLTKYQPGMNYGQHADNAFLHIGQNTLRSDLSCTLFLHDPATYDGGELSVQLGSGTVDFKLNAGGAIIYPSNTIHQVKPVTRGERLAAITFFESRIVDQTSRELLYQINEVKELEGLTMKPENRLRMNYVSSSLERLWGGES